MSAILWETAEGVREGDSLPGLDNGYVYEAPADATDVLRWGGGPAAALPRDLVYIPFHTAEGEEAFVVLPREHPIQVAR